MDNPIRVALNEDDFRKLVAGNVVYTQTEGEGHPVWIILSDIGFDRIYAAVDTAVQLSEAMRRE